MKKSVKCILCRILGLTLAILLMIPALSSVCAEAASQGILEMDTRSYVMAPGNKYEFKAAVSGGGLQQKNVKVSDSRNGTIVRLTALSNGNYMITALSVGTTYVVAEINGAHASIKVTVQKGVKQHGEACRSRTIVGVLMPSAIALQKPRYITLDNAGKYNKAVITDELKNKKSTLPEASSSSIPYWTGFCNEAKGFVNPFGNKTDDRWGGTYGPNYFYENQFRFASQSGFNCMRLLYSMSYLSNPNNVMQVNESELEQLDEAISWGMKYNLHIMVSITGLPGKRNTSMTEENVQSSDELFRNSQLADTFKKYFVMLAKRYVDIPNKNLSFELLAEPSVPDGNLELYENQMLDVANGIWAVSPGRILIANDLAKQLPERLAQAGCCLSLHNHIYTVDSTRMPQVPYKGHWPMEYLPSSFDGAGNQVLTLKSENGFTQGTLKIYMERQWSQYGGLVITADGKTLISGGHDKDAIIQAAIPQGTRQIAIKSANANVRMSGIQLAQVGKTPVTIPVHDMYTGVEGTEKMPTILIKNDGTTQNADNPQIVLNSEYFTKTYMQEFIDCAKRNNVGFLLTEVGTDTEDLSLKECQEYESVWLTALKTNHIPWMWNCMEGVYAPKDRLWPQKIVSQSVIQQDSNTPFFENKSMIDFMKKYQ